jgi:short-subunit dehydrogenase
MRLRGSKALVTGASSGIGEAIASRFLSEGAEVWGTSRNPASKRFLPGIRPLRLDISRFSQIEADWREQELEAVGFDIVVNNAGSGVFGRFAESDFEDWKSQIEMLLIGTMKVTRLVLPGLIEREGYLVNVSSLAAEFPVPFMSAYNASKAGLSAFTESVILETQPSGMKAIDLRPGDIKTGFNCNMMVKSGKIENQGCVNKVWRRIEKRISESPSPDLVADKLCKAIRKDRAGVVRAGTRFQACLAPLLRRFVPAGWTRAGNISYYTE